MRRKNHTILKNKNMFSINFDNSNKDNSNRLLSYLTIINSLNYKWYKSSKRRFLLPSFYFTRSFCSFFKIYFFKNIFIKKIQFFEKYYFYNPCFMFERKMFFKKNPILDLFETNKVFFLFLSKFHVNLLNKNCFFFKKNNFVTTNSTLYVDKLVDLDVSLKNSLFLFKKTDNNQKDFLTDFNFLIFFLLTNQTIVEIYKTNVLLFLNSCLNKF